MTNTIELDQLAAATHAAMHASQPFVQLASSLLAAESRAARDALLREADPEAREAALLYLAEPEPTRDRERRLSWMRADPRRVSALKHYYAKHIDAFVSDWGMTTDPRRLARGQPAQVPFVLFPKQVEFINWLLERWRTGTHGTVVKSRDVGASYVSMALLASLCLFERNFAAGVASATEAKLDLSNSPDTLFAKLREFLGSIPEEFRGGYIEDKHSMNCRIFVPDTGSSIVGEVGGLAGRSARKALYIVDESAFFLVSIDAALAQTTDVRIDISTPNGIGNSFYRRAHNDEIPRFNISWRDRPDRDEAWYRKQVETLDPVVLAQEINCDFAASREGVVIPSAWAQSAVGLIEKLDIKPTGRRYAALDLGDKSDRCALAIRHGPYLEHLESWSGAGSDMARSAAHAFRICDEHGVNELLYDADGLGGPFNGFARVLNEQRLEAKRIYIFEYRGSGSPFNPTSYAPRTNIKWEDYVLNRKAQAWMHMRSLLEHANLAASGREFDADSFAAFNPAIRELSKLLPQLSQPTMSENAAGKLVIDKLGEGERSPDLADAVVMVFAPSCTRINWAGALEVL